MDAAMSLARGMLEADVAKRLPIEDALRHPWLQPVSDEATREALNIAVSEAAVQRRQARVSEKARRRLRVSALKVIAMRRLSDGGLSSDEIRKALHANAEATAAEAKAGAPTVVPPSSSALAQLEKQQEDGKAEFRQRRLSESSSISYKSNEFEPRMI